MGLTNVISLLRPHDIFSCFDTVRLEILAFTAEHARFEVGETIFRAGDVADAAHLIISGEAVLLAYSGSKAGREAKAFRLDRGDLIGEASLLTPGVRQSTMRAVTRLETLRIGRSLFARLLEEFPEMATAVLEALSRRLEQTGHQLEQAASVMDSGRRFPKA